MTTKTRRPAGLPRVTPEQLTARVKKQYAPSFQAVLDELDERSAFLLSQDVLTATGLTEYGRVGSLQVVRDTETGWMGLACGLAS